MMPKQNKHVEFHKTLSKLQAMLAIKDAQLMANPKPYLEDMENRCAELLQVFDDIENALSSNCVFDYWEDNADHDVLKKPVDVQGEALIRCDAALKVINKYKDGRY